MTYIVFHSKTYSSQKELLVDRVVLLCEFLRVRLERGHEAAVLLYLVLGRGGVVHDRSAYVDHLVRFRLRALRVGADLYFSVLCLVALKQTVLAPLAAAAVYELVPFYAICFLNVPFIVAHNYIVVAQRDAYAAANEIEQVPEVARDAVLVKAAQGAPKRLQHVRHDAQYVRVHNTVDHIDR